MAGIARQVQDIAEPVVLDKGGPVSAYCRVEVVPGPVLRVAVEHVTGNQGGFPDPIKELIASLRLYPIRKGRQKSNEDRQD